MLRAASVRDKKVYIGPEILYLPVTNRCNLSCQFCWFYSPDNPAQPYAQKDMPLERVQQIIRDCVALKVDSLEISGDGEPTLYPYFSEMMDFFEEKPIAITLFTNGTFPSAMSTDVAKADDVIINLSAVDRDGYHQLHGKDLFDRAIDNIRQLVRLRDTGRSSLRIKVIYVINRMNYQQIDVARRLTQGLGVDTFVPTVMNEYAWNRNVRVDVAPGIFSGEGGISEVCFNGWFYTILDLDGKIRLCFQVPNIEVLNITGKSFSEVWSSDAFMQARLAGKHGQWSKKFKDCQACVRFRQNMNVVKAIYRLKQYCSAD